jgi:hypothetical protein
MSESKYSTVKFAPLDTTYGSTSLHSYNSVDSDEDANMIRSFHLGTTQVNASNVWTSVRHTTSFAEHGDEYHLVPTQLTENVKLVTDPNLDSTQKGTLYYAEDVFYNNNKEPRFALTVHSDIYGRILSEVKDATTTPCGLYFCCHGGDGAHSGVSHDDYVDIRMAWMLLTVIFASLMFLSWTVPWPKNDTDDFFE